MKSDSEQSIIDVPLVDDQIHIESLDNDFVVCECAAAATALVRPRTLLFPVYIIYLEKKYVKVICFLLFYFNRQKILQSATTNSTVIIMLIILI